MAAQSGGFWRSGWTGALCCFWLLNGLPSGAPAPVVAQPPAVEMWQGNRRIGQTVQPAPVPQTLQRLPAILPQPTGGHLEQLGQTLPPIRGTTLHESAPPRLSAPPTFTAPPPMRGPAPAERAGRWQQQLMQAGHHLLDDCENTVNTCVGTVSTSTGQVVEALAVVTEQVATATEAAPPSGKPSSQLVPPPAAGAASAELTWPWVQIATLAFVVAAPFALAVGLALILRWSGMKFRVEIINSGAVILQDVQGLRAQMPMTAGMPVTTGTPAGEAGSDLLCPGVAIDAMTVRLDDPVTPPEDVFTGEYFDIGPTFDEERRLREEALLAGERAVLQEVFEQNLRLQQEIRDLGPDLDDEVLTEDDAPLGYVTPTDGEESTDAART